MGSIISAVTTIVISLISGQPSEFIYWCKWIISYIYVGFARRSIKRRFGCYDEFADNDPHKVGFISWPEEIAIESPIEDSKLNTNSDEVFCYGINSQSECLVVRVARKCNNNAEAWIYLKLNNGKTYQLQETFGYQQSSCEKKVFSCGGLQLHYIIPLRKWRIYFNGMISVQSSSENQSVSEEMVHLKFALLWTALSDVFDFATDAKTSAIAHGLAKAKWAGFIPPFKKLINALDTYVQCGTIMGTITIENEEEKNIYLFGERIRYSGNTSEIKQGSFSYILGYAHKNGSFVHLTEVSIKNVVENLHYGFIVQPTGQMCIISDDNLHCKTFTTENETENLDLKLHIEEQEKPFELKRGILEQRNNFLSKTGYSGQISVDYVDFNLNSLKCGGLEIKGSVQGKPKAVKPKDTILKTPSIVPFTVSFRDVLCQNSNVTGGKGSSLGKLTHLSEDFKNFIVPRGIVVTTSACQRFLTNDIRKEIKHLENVLYGNKPGNVKDACNRVEEEIKGNSIPEEVQHAIEESLRTNFSDINDLKFAVRSSATGEDTEQMSAAGQMETFLGVKSMEEILNSLKKCWASQFSFIAVQYKRQNGQIINSPMAVVIQEMIPCDVAGVIFTCNPLNGNPNILTITSNYGLGESVVSASEEPDTIELKREFDDKITIINKVIGAKSRRIILNEDKGTNAEDVSEHDRQVCSLSDEMAIRLGNLSVKIEKSYRSHRDIEWGFWNNILYIFQSRPITSGCGETDFEIDHEFDAPLRIENEYFTVCNVGEVMPGAMSTLGLDILMKYFRITMQKGRASWETFKHRYYPRGIVSMYGRFMFFCFDLLEKLNESRDIGEAMMVALFGRVVDDEEMLNTMRERFQKQKKPLLNGPREFIKILYRMYRSKLALEDALDTYSNYRIPFEKCKTSQELFEMLLHSCTDLDKPMWAHMLNSETSIIWNLFIFNILKRARGGINSEVYNDFGKLVTMRSNVESADVPASIDRLAHFIIEEKKSDDLKEMSSKDFADWLTRASTPAGREYRNFMVRHGHRCLKEFDMRTKTWETDPTTLIELVKNLVSSFSEEKTKNVESKEEKNINEILTELNLPLAMKTRLVLKFLIPQSRKAVQCRETSKSLLIKSQDAWRKAYYHLSKLMVAEGRIPDEDLLYFMTLNEIKELLDTRSPKILSRANHRRRRFPVLDKYIFPEIMKGFPKPLGIDDTSNISDDENFSMKGIPVSQGQFKGYVRVALNLEEASKLQAGEILLTYSTDIGWSPYFPILGGVVTELGGLISHGAVVSREYGLPCIAGLHGATRQFQTGDYVLMDGSKGILQKLPKPQE